MLNFSLRVKLRTLLVIIAAVMMMMVGAVPAHVFAADQVYDNAKHLDSIFNFGRGHSDSDDTSTLAWSESYILESYMNLYQAYGDTYWLDKFIDHFDRVKNNAYDLEDDGYYGWYSAKYSLQHLWNPSFEESGPGANAVELLENGDFELWDGDVSTPSDWVRESGDSSVVFRSTNADEYYEGNAGLVIKYNGGNSAVLKQQFDYTPGQEYTVSFAVKTNSRHTNGRIVIYNETNSKEIGSSVSFADESLFVDEWRKGTFNFKAPPVSRDLTIKLMLYYDDQSDWEVYFDNLSIQPVEGQSDDNILENGRFEDVDSQDPTLPEGWHRYRATSSNAYLSNNLNEYYNNSDKIGNGMVVEAGETETLIVWREIPYDPGQEYTVTFDGRVNDPDVRGEIRVVDHPGTPLGSIVFKNTDWGKKSFSFTAPNTSGHSVRLRIRVYDTTTEDWKVFVDNIEVRPVKNRGFRSWSRVGKDINTAYATNESGGYKYGSYGLAVGNDGVNDGYVEQEFMAYEPDKLHSVYYDGKTNHASTGGKVIVYDETASTVLAEQSFYNTEWGSKDLEFTTPSDPSHVIKIRLTQTEYTNNNHIAYFDRVRAGEVTTILHDQMMVTRPALLFVKAVYEDSDLQQAYFNKANVYLNFIKDDVYPAWDTYYRDLDSEKGIFIKAEGNRGRWTPGRSLPHNQYLMAAENYLLLWDITDNNWYKTRATKLYNTFKGKLFINPDVNTAYEWKYADFNHASWDEGYWKSYDPRSGGEDISHGSFDISAVVTAFNYGVVFDAGDMEKFTSTFLDVMWNGSTTFPLFGDKVFKTGQYTSDIAMTQLHMRQWVKLAQFDPQVWEIIKNIPVRDEGNPNFKLLTQALLAVYNPEYMVNGGFELVDTDDGTLPAFWSRYHSDSFTVYRDTANKDVGKAGLAVKTDGLYRNTLEQQMTGYVPNSDYVLKITAKTDGLGQRARGNVYDYTTHNMSVSAFVYGTDWTEGSVAFTTPGNTGNNIRVRLYQSQKDIPNRSVYFDNVRLYAAMWNSFIPNGGFEQSDDFDASLPKWWKRDSTVSESDIAIDPNNEYKGLNSLKIVTPSSGNNELYYSWYGFKTNTTYELTFHSKVETGGTGRVYVKNESTGNIITNADITFSNTSWENKSLTFTTPSAYTDELRVYITNDTGSTSGKSIYVDEMGMLLSN